MYLSELFLFSSLIFQKKASALFEVAEVFPVMTNNYEDSILRGVRVSFFLFSFLVLFVVERMPIIVVGMVQCLV